MIRKMMLTGTFMALAGVLAFAEPSTQPSTQPAAAEGQSHTAENGLVITELKAGHPGAQDGDILLVHYVGTLDNGTKFDSSYDNGQPIRLTLGQGNVIKGWDLGLVGMVMGEKRRLVIPPALGYGDKTQGPIPANSTLHFDVELVGLVRLGH